MTQEMLSMALTFVGRESLNFRDNNKMTNQKGFTLIELLVVISIISLLSSVVMTSMGAAKEKAQASSIVQTLTQLRNAIETYITATGKYPQENTKSYSTTVTPCGSSPLNRCFNNTLGPLVNKYIPELPTKLGGQPLSGSNSYFYATDFPNLACNQTPITDYAIGIYYNKSPLDLPVLRDLDHPLSTFNGYYCITTN